MRDPFVLARGKPFRDNAPDSVDWRWKKICELADLPPVQARYQLEKLNDLVLTAGYEFKRAIDRGFPFEDDLPAIARAYRIFTSDARSRLLIEGMTLAGITPEMYSWDRFGLDESTVDAYEALFFDVRPRLQMHGWVVAKLFQGVLYNHISSRDQFGMTHRLAWLCGADFFYSYYTGEWCEEFQQKATERLRDMFYKMSFIQSFCRSHAGEIDVETLRVVITDIKDTAKAELEKAKNSKGGDDQADAVMATLQQLPLSVADPSLQSNLNQPARDLRAEDQFAALAKPTEAEVSR